LAVQKASGRATERCAPSCDVDSGCVMAVTTNLREFTTQE
jgi:hypothetical protein